jgi:hypothetical protein
MNLVYVRTNFLIDSDVSDAIISKWQELLHNAALEGGADDVDVFYSDIESIIGVSIPLEEDAMLILEAGHVLGYIHSAVDSSDLKYSEFWMSINDEFGAVIESPR